MSNRRLKALEIVIELAQSGVTLITNHDQQLMFHPQSGVTEKQCNQLKLYKRDILNYLDSLLLSDDWEETNIKTVNKWCPAYDHSKGWRSVYGDHLMCGTCYPPVSDQVVAEWIQRE